MPSPGFGADDSMTHHDIPRDLTSCLRQIERETFIRRAEWFMELASTNSQAMTLAGQDESALPLLIGAIRQSAGRGRGQNAWWSADGALTFSLLFNPLEHGLPFSRWPQIALATGLAVADTLESYLPPASVQLKWPNDVYAAGRKICGILTEVPSGRTDRLVVGIGVNVRNSLREAPAELQSTAVSLIDLLGDSCPLLGEILFAMVTRWHAWLQRLAAGEIDFPTLWRTKCYLTGHQVTVSQGPETLSGTCLGLDRDGTLLLESDGGVQRILAGTIRRR